MAALSSLFEAHKLLVPQFKAVVKQRAQPKAKEREEGEEEGEEEEEEKERSLHEGEDRRVRGKRKRRKEEDPRDSRTVFVGNLPITYTRKKVKQLFRQYGTVETVRLRSMKVEKGRLPPEVAKRTLRQLGGSSVNAYVVFSCESEAESAVAFGGSEVEGRHVRVDLTTQSRDHQHQRSVFVGNLPFTVDEEALRTAFEECGEVEAVRVVRDSQLRIGKGFGFVLFREKSGVMFALKKNKKIELEGRVLRVFRSKEEGAASQAGRRQPAFAGTQAKKSSGGKGKGRWRERKGEGGKLKDGAKKQSVRRSKGSKRKN